MYKFTNSLGFNWMQNNNTNNNKINLNNEQDQISIQIKLYVNELMIEESKKKSHHPLNVIFPKNSLGMIIITLL